MVLNETAGSFDAEFKRICEGRCPNATFGTIDDVGGSWDVVIACGGDGTVRRVVNALIAAKSDAALGIVPLGTGNVIARALGLPLEQEQALEVALDENERRIDVGWCHEEAFLIGCGLGLAERFVTQVGYEDKRRLGAAAYLRKLMAERHAPRVTFCVDFGDRTERMQGVGLIVANLAQLGPSIRPLKEVKPDDGRLGVIVLRHSGFWALLRIGLFGLFGRAAHDPAVELRTARSCRVSSDPKVPIQIDGDEWDQKDPFEFSVLPERLRVRTPVQ